ncbi:50S ribosomal protein L6, partial [Burkholderia pseudomallei]
GLVAAEVRVYRPPVPYKVKGVSYAVVVVILIDRK